MVRNTSGPEGGLFTRSGSAAAPFLAEQLSAMPTPKNNLWNAQQGLKPGMSNRIAVLKREEGIGRPLGFLHPSSSGGLAALGHWQSQYGMMRSLMDYGRHSAHTFS
jgi:hypothetical protein